MVYDAERRPREWSRRVSGLGGDRSRVVYVEPTDLPSSHVGRPLWDLAIAAEIWCPLDDPVRRDPHGIDLNGIARLGVLARAYGLKPDSAI